jgi:uncharacterized protein YqgQ
MILKVIVFLVFLISNSFASITDDLLKLTEMYQQGLLTKEEFTKAKSILLEIEDIEKEEKKSNTKITKKKDKKPIQKNKVTKKKNKKIKIQRIFTSEGSKFTNKNFEKMKLLVGDYNIYTHRPGAVKIKQMSSNKQLAVIGDKFKVKYYNGGRDKLNIEVNKDTEELSLKINNSRVLLWKGKYIQQAKATFYQILAMGRLPFHFYIKFDKADNAVAINMEKFNRSIELAVEETKKELSVQHNITLAEIESIIEENDMMAAYGEKIPINLNVQTNVRKKNELYAKLKDSLGDENFTKLSSILESEAKDKIDLEINKQVENTIDESIRDAINSGLEAAALEAAINAAVKAYLSGADWADIYGAAQKACAGAGGSC